MTQITDEMKVAAVKAYTEVDGKCRPAAMQKALEAALPFLPIAVEGKVRTARAEAADEILGLLTGHELYQYRPKAFQGFIDYVRENFSTASLTGKATAPINWEDANDPAVKLFVGYDAESYVEEYELRGDDGDYTPNESEKSLLIDAIYGVVGDIHEKLRAIIPSSPGKDGGQEVDAAEWQGRYWIEDEGRWSNWITNPVGYPWAHDLQEGKSEIRYLYPQPASTALVERLTKALEKIAEEATVANDVIRLNRDGGGNGRVKVATAMHRIAETSRSALSASTSREGER